MNCLGQMQLMKLFLWVVGFLFVADITVLVMLLNKTKCATQCVQTLSMFRAIM